MHNSSAGLTGLSASGAVPAMSASQLFAASTLGASGKVIMGSPSGTPAFMSFHTSSLPTNSSFDSLWSRIWRTVLAASVGYSGTETWPAIQIAQSAIIQCALFFASSAMRVPGSRFKPFR